MSMKKTSLRFSINVSLGLIITLYKPKTNKQDNMIKSIFTKI